MSRIQFSCRQKQVRRVIPCIRVLLALTSLAAVPAPAAAQQKPRFESWPAFEASADLKAYRRELSAGNGFTDRHRQLLVVDALPQLLQDANRNKLASIRVELAGMLLGKITSAAAHREASTAAIEALDELARRKGPVEGTVNACLLLGELREQEGQLLVAATPVLCELTLDATVTPAVRVAALVGLRARVQATGSGGSPEIKGAAVALLPTFTKLLKLDKPPTDGTDVVIDWLQQRSLDLAANVIQLAAADSEPLAALGSAALELLQDAEKPINLRIRAAVLLGRLLKPDEGQPAAEIAELIDAVAIAAVVEDRQAIKLIKLRQTLGGLDLQAGGPAMRTGTMMMGPDGEPLTVVPSLLSESRCLQTSWRLASLADALATLANTRGEAGKPYETQAERLRNLSIEIYKSPSDDTVLAAADALNPLPEPAAEPSDTRPATAPGMKPTPEVKPSTPFSPFQIR